MAFLAALQRTQRGEPLSAVLTASRAGQASTTRHRKGCLREYSFAAFVCPAKTRQWRQWTRGTTREPWTQGGVHGRFLPRARHRSAYEATLPSRLPAGKDVFVGWCLIGVDELNERAPIGLDVRLGAGAMPEVMSGEGLVVGIGTVITKNITPYMIVADAPASVLRPPRMVDRSTVGDLDGQR